MIFNTNFLKMKQITILLLFIFAAALSGCSTLASKLAKKDEAGVVIARRAQVRSSTAVVAADLVEVNRGDQVDILDSDVDQNGERWLRVRAHDEENTEGWIESRNVMPNDVLERSRKLAEEDKDVPPQATGQLRASTNLRLSPDRNGNENIMMKLDSGSKFDIITWKRVPKPKTSETTESDTAPKAGSVQNANKGKKDSDEEKEPEETNELWYKVRLSPSISPAPGGWIYGKQVELTVPSDIIFYRTGREFVAWHRLDSDADVEANSKRDKDAAKDAKPGSWVILEKSSSNEPHKIDEPDFDRIYVLGYDKYNQEHYTAYRSPDLKGFLPLRVDEQGENKTFIVRIQDEDGQIKEQQYKVFHDDRGFTRVTPPGSGEGQKGRRKR
ncbi:MAG: hypothetical protein WBP93_22585 [Pyrinomonadaceae bacterium]